MKRIIPIKTRLFAAAFAALGSLASAQAGSFFADFNDGLLPAGTTIFPVSSIAPSGGYANTGYLSLMTDVGSQSGAFILDDLDPSMTIVSFRAAFKVYIGSVGNGADGMSFNFAPDLPLGTYGQEGAGTGLTVEFDTYPNTPEVGATLDVKVGGTEVATKLFPAMRPGRFVDVVIQLNPGNTLDVIYDGVYVYSKLDLSVTSPSYTPAAGSRFGFGAATGGTSDNVWIDNLSINTRTAAAAYVASFAPQTRRTQPNDPLDIVLTDSTTHVTLGSIVLKLDGATVVPSIQANTPLPGQTTIHYAPPANFDYYTTHAVTLTFADDASPTHNTTTLDYEFTVVAQYAVIFADGFESYNAGSLDQNDGSGPNQAPNGGPGNPWFGPVPANGIIVGTEGSISPHSGTQMVRGANGGTIQFDQDYYNLAYRLNGGSVYKGNIRLDWWFYDLNGPGDTNYRDYVALVDYGSYQSATDQDGSGNPGPSTSINQRLSLGATFLTGADYTKYQARVVSADDPGIAGTSGWFNTTTTRSVGWHHGRIAVGPTQGTMSAPEVAFYIDDMVNPTLVHNAISTIGYNFIEINTQFGTETAYFDDISFAVAQPPKLTATLSGVNVMLTWPGDSYTLQSASVVTGPYTDVGASPTASPYSYDTTTNPQQFFRLRN